MQHRAPEDPGRGGLHLEGDLLGELHGVRPKSGRVKRLPIQVLGHAVNQLHLNEGYEYELVVSEIEDLNHALGPQISGGSRHGYHYLFQNVGETSFGAGVEAADAAIGYWSMVNDAMKRLSDKDMTKQPYDQSNSVACLLWHMNRIVDNMTHARLQSQRQLWVLEGWHQKSAWAGPADGCGSSLEGSSGQARGRLPMSETPLHFKTISELATLIKPESTDGHGWTA